MKRCPFCAEAIQDAAIVCRFCGRDLPTQRKESAASTILPDEPFTARQIVGIFAAVIAFGLIVVMIVSERDGTQRSPAEPPSGVADQSANVQRNRSSALAAQIRRAGETCDSVTRIFLQGRAKNGGTFWNVACADGHAYVVSGTGDADDKIMSCAMMKLIAKTDCFVAFTDQN